MTALPCLLGPDVPVHVDVLRRLAASWRDELGADLVPLRCATVEEVVSRACSAGEAPGAVADVGMPATRALLDELAAASAPVALVSTRNQATPFGDEPESVFRIEGRGIGGYRWGALSVLRRAALPFTRVRYGSHPEQVADLRLPASPAPHPVVVLVHGGGWKDLWRRDIMEGLALDLAAAGVASWNLDFRRVGPSGGGWPATFDDVSAGVRALAAHEDVLALDRLALVGHSSGGHLVLAQAARDDSPQPRLVASLAGVVDVVEGARRGLVGGETIVHRLLGGSPDDVPERYAAVSPRALLPLGVPQLLVQGLLDYIPDLVDLNRLYADAARAAGDEVELVELESADHMAPIDPRSEAWSVVRDRLLGTLRPAPAVSA